MADDKDDLEEKRKLRRIDNEQYQPPAGTGLNERFDMNLDEQIRDTALGSAVHFLTTRAARGMKPIDEEMAVEVAKRFERYIRGGE